MKRFLLMTIVGVLSLSVSAAYAAKLMVSVTPEGLEAHGFLMKVEAQSDGTVRFTLTRDLSKAQQFPAESDLQISRHATLRVYDTSGLRVQCGLAADTRQPGFVSYGFTMAQDCVARSSFELAEDHDYRDPTREHLIGGGTHYRFALAPFVPLPKP